MRDPLDDKLDNIVALYGNEKVLTAMRCAADSIESVSQSFNPREGVEIFAIMAEYLRKRMAHSAEASGKDTFANVAAKFDETQKKAREALS